MLSISNDIKEKISIEIINVLVTRFDSFPDENQSLLNAPFHEAFLAAFSEKIGKEKLSVPRLLSLSSWLHGLNTTLGQSFFEKVAAILCGGEKREWTSGREGNLPISKPQKDTINTIITELSNDREKPDLDRENKSIASAREGLLGNAIDFSADVFYEENDKVVAIEIKSVQPNSGELKGEKQKILEGKAALQRKFPNKDVYFYLGFPFDRTVNLDEGEDPCSSDKKRFMDANINCTKYLAEEEVLLASELWDYLSGEEGTMQAIISIINTIATPQFYDNFVKLTEYDIIRGNELSKLLSDWNLFSELTFLENIEYLNEKAKSDKRLYRYMRQGIFDVKGKLKEKRKEALEDALKEIKISNG